MAHPLIYEVLEPRHIDELAPVLLNDEVYRYIGGEPPTYEQFRRHTERVLAGPPSNRPEIVWINYVVHLETSGQLVGRLEATAHDGLAEVAFLFGPEHWGKGYATLSLLWFNELLLAGVASRSLWASADPRNLRSHALLERCGYVRVPPVNAPQLFTYEEGDYVFTWCGAA